MCKLLSLPKTQALIGCIIFCLCMMPLMGLGKHIHLAEQHMGNELHAHQIETHGFHLHANHHDSIDAGDLHTSDAQQVDIQVDTPLNKIFKIVALLGICLALVAGFITAIQVTRSIYLPSYRLRFEIFHSLLRGPPLV